MRFFYPNLERPKSAAKRLRRSFRHVTLSDCQQAVAHALGYANWHALEREHTSSLPTQLDEHVSILEARSRWVSLTLTIARTLSVPDGHVQSVLSDIRVSGNRKLTLEDHEVVRTACWRAGTLPSGRRRTPGSTCLATYEGRRSTARRAYIREIVTNIGGSKSIELITDSAGHGGREDFEVICPRAPLDDFVPLCLWLPYGWCTMSDGSELLFSREYKPLWKISADGRVERVAPWENLERPFSWFKDMTSDSWASPATKSFALERLDKHRISSLPMLADAFPILMSNPEWTETRAIEALREQCRLP